MSPEEAAATLDPDDPGVLYLKLPNKTQFVTIRKTLAQLDDVLRTGDQAPTKKLLLDLGSVVFCSATGITILAAVLEDLFRRGKLAGGQIWLPNNPLAMKYLQRMNFFAELRVEIPEAFTRRAPKSFYPVTHVPDEGACPAITRELVAPCQTNLSLDQPTVNALKTCVNEMIENVFYHAESPTDALVSAQAYKKRQRVELVIADTGRGIRAAFADSPEYAARSFDDCHAVRLALEKNVTSTGDVRRGIGLWVASELARCNGGEFLILSKEGGVRVVGDDVSDVTDLFWPGTLVAIEFRLDRPINLKAVYDSGDFPDVDSYDF